MSTDTITIQGFDFTVPDRYSEGHILTENEAAALNQTYHENLRNNFASKVRAAKEAAGGNDPDLEALQSALDAYAEAYVFGKRVAGAPRAPADPVGKEAFSIARDAVKAAIRKKGLNPTSYTAAQIAELAQGALEKNKERFMAAARERIAEREALASSDLDGLDDLPAPVPAEPTLDDDGEPVAPVKRGRKPKTAEAA